MIKRTYTYLIPFIMYWIIGIYLWIKLGYNNSFLVLNQHYNAFADIIFPHFTILADGILLSCIFGLVVIKKDKALIISMTIGLLLVAQVISYLKYRVFEGYHRPFIIFGEEMIHYITLEDEKYCSFPSGHSAAAAAMGFFFAYYHGAKTQIGNLFWAFLMIALCYSRIYIGVHFLADTIVGSMIGIGIASASMFFIYPFLQKWLDNLPFERVKKLEYGLIGLAIVLFVLDIIRIITEIYGK